MTLTILYGVGLLATFATVYTNKLDRHDREQRMRRAEPLPLTEIYWRPK